MLSLELRVQHWGVRCTGKLGEKLSNNYKKLIPVDLMVTYTFHYLPTGAGLEIIG